MMKHSHAALWSSVVRMSPALPPESCFKSYGPLAYCCWHICAGDSGECKINNNNNRFLGL